MVCWLHDIARWELCQGGCQYVMLSCPCCIMGQSLTSLNEGFVVFDQIKSTLQDPDGKLSSSNTIVAGLGAGVFESVLAVTPFESIKTSLYAYIASFYLNITHDLQYRRPEIRQTPFPRSLPCSTYHSPRTRHAWILPRTRPYHRKAISQ